MIDEIVPLTKPSRPLKKWSVEIVLRVDSTATLNLNELIDGILEYHWSQRAFRVVKGRFLTSDFNGFVKKIELRLLILNFIWSILFGEKIKLEKLINFFYGQEASMDISRGKFILIPMRCMSFYGGTSEVSSIFIQRWNYWWARPSNWTESRCADSIWIWSNIIRFADLLPSFRLIWQNLKRFLHEGRIGNGWIDHTDRQKWKFTEFE